MDNNYLENFINRFPNVLLSHTLKLSDITDSKAVQLDDSQMLKSIEAFPNKFELEIIRFWRKKKLLPFFEEGPTDLSLLLPRRSSSKKSRLSKERNFFAQLSRGKPVELALFPPAPPPPPPPARVTVDDSPTPSLPSRRKTVNRSSSTDVSPSSLFAEIKKRSRSAIVILPKE